MLRFNILVLLMLFISCIKSNEEIDKNIPTCIQEILDDNDLSKDIKTIKVQENSDELHYWINTDFNHFDGPEFIVNMKCDTVCTLCGECTLPECAFEYENEWIIIWEN